MTPRDLFRRLADDPAMRPGQITRRIRQEVEVTVFRSPRVGRFVARQFHRSYYYLAEQTWHDTTWLGTTILKCPLDVWKYQELLTTLRPDVIVECGTLNGGSARFLASMCDLLDSGRIISIDIEEKEGRPTHDRISYLLGSSTSTTIVDAVKKEVGSADTVLVILDSDHSRDHVLDELRIYSEIATPKSYIIVEDTNVNGHPVSPAHGPGPQEAISAFLAENSHFARDEYWDKFLMSFNPGGFLKKEAATI